MRGFLLGAKTLVTGWQGLFDDGGALAGTAYATWLPQLMNVLSTVMWVVLALVGAAGGLYAIYVGIKMARADSAEQRDENKKRMINIIVAIVVTIVLIIFFNIFLPMILNAVMASDANLGQGDDKTGQSGTGSQSISAVVTAAKVLLRLPL